MHNLAEVHDWVADDTTPAAEWMDEALAVCRRICAGDFEARILDVPAEPGTQRQLILKINEMIDRMDAYVRESTACLHYVEKNRYFRRIIEDGMRGSFLTASRAINHAADGVTETMDVFGGLVGSLNEALATCQDGASGMVTLASETREQSVTVAAAAEQALANVQTVASAAEELSSSIQDAVGSIANIEGRIQQLNEAAGSIASAVEEQGAATSEIARNIEEASSGVADITTGISKVSQDADAVSRSSGEILTIADGLKQQANELRTELQPKD